MLRVNDWNFFGRIEDHEKMKRGRPSDYSPELAEAICAGIAEGLLLPEVCKRPGMPSPATIFVWLNKFPEFLEQYATAKEIQCEILAGETNEVADTLASGRRLRRSLMGRRRSPRATWWTVPGSWSTRGSGSSPRCSRRSTATR
jgi:hypothetical protein